MLNPLCGDEIKQHGEMLWPEEAWIALTNRCNFACIYCSSNSGPEEAFGLSTGAWIRCIKELLEINVKKFTITGGEPLLHPATEPVLALLDKSKCSVILSTNASLLDDFWISKLAAMTGVLVDVNMHCADPYLFDQITGSNNCFGKVVNNISRLVKSGVNVRCQTIVGAKNVGGIKELVDLCYSLGVGEIVLRSYDGTDFSSKVMSAVGEVNCGMKVQFLQGNPMEDNGVVVVYPDGRFLNGHFPKRPIKELWNERHNHLCLKAKKQQPY